MSILRKQSGTKSETSRSQLYPCPCCGFASLESPGGNDVCTVCLWEDDGTDNSVASWETGANRVTLNLGRANYLLFGIAEPKHKDLMPLRDPMDQFVKSRIFEIDDQKHIVEKDKNAKVLYRSPVPYQVTAEPPDNLRDQTKEWAIELPKSPKFDLKNTIWKVRK